MSGLVPTCCAVGLIVFFGAPTLSQPQLAVPVRTFPPGVQVDSPVPINRGNDSLGLEGFRQPDKSRAAKNLSEATSSPNTGNSDDSSSGSDSMFGYEKRVTNPDSAKERNSEMAVDVGDSRMMMRTERERSIEDASVFGSATEDDCSKVDSVGFCRAFN